MRLKILLILLFVTAALYSSAETNCVVIRDKEDRETVIPIKNASEITFDGNIMIIGSEKFNMSLLNKYYFADAATLGIEEISGEAQGLKIDSKGVITFDENIDVRSVSVFNMKGIAQSFKLNSTSIDIRNLTPDVYIVKIGDVTIKFVKR